MAARSRKPRDPDTHIRPTTQQLFDALRASTTAQTENRMLTAGLVAQVSQLTELTRESVGNTARLVELSERRDNRDEVLFQAQLERDKASQEAQHRRSQAEVAEAAARGAWLREKVGDRILIPLGALLVSAVSSVVSIVATWAMMRLGQPTQTVNVGTPPPVVAPAPEPEPPVSVPDPVPEPEPAPQPRPRSRPELLPLQMGPEP